MKKMILANWKANFGPDRAMRWLDTFAGTYRARTDVEVILAVPVFMLERVAGKVAGIAGVRLAAQSVSSYPQGSYTGSTPAAWLRGLADYVLIGHRERRKYFHETIQDVARQSFEALHEELKPIVCADQSLLTSQAAAMEDKELDHLIWAYTPETPETLEMARTAADIAQYLPQMARRTNNRPVLYGGGVTPANAAGLWKIPGLSGLMLGSGCLDAAAFAGLVNQL